MTVAYRGEKHCELVHGPSGRHIDTDAPKDNNGRGEAFSPTDLCSISLASRMITIMAIAAEKEGQSLEGAHAEVEKEMKAEPRRIGRIGLTLHLPSKLDATWREKLEKAAMNCPVKLSLHPDVVIDAKFRYDV